MKSNRPQRKHTFYRLLGTNEKRAAKDNVRGRLSSKARYSVRFHVMRGARRLFHSARQIVEASVISHNTPVCYKADRYGRFAHFYPSAGVEYGEGERGICRQGVPTKMAVRCSLGSY